MFVVSSMQCACTILPSVGLPPALQYFFFHYLINGTIFEKKIESKISVLIFSVNFIRKISRSEKHWARYYLKHILVSMCSTCYSCQFLMKLDFFGNIFEKPSNIIFHKNPSFGSRFCSTKKDRRDEDNIRFSKCLECACKSAVLNSLEKLYLCLWCFNICTFDLMMEIQTGSETLCF